MRLKALIIFTVILTVFSTAVFAEYLITADCIPAGKLAVSGAYVGTQYEQNDISGYRSSLRAAEVSNYNAFGLRGGGAAVTYGINDKIELTLGYGIAGGMDLSLDLLSGVGGGRVEVWANSITGALKLGIFQESRGDDFSLALGLMTKQGSVRTIFPSAIYQYSSTANTSQYTVGLLASLQAIPFIPYVGVGYEANITDKADLVYGAFQNSLGFVVGTAFCLSRNLITYWEFSTRSYSSGDPSKKDKYNTTEYAGRLAWIIN